MLKPTIVAAETLAMTRTRSYHWPSWINYVLFPAFFHRQSPSTLTKTFVFPWNGLIRKPRIVVSSHTPPRLSNVACLHSPDHQTPVSAVNWRNTESKRLTFYPYYYNYYYYYYGRNIPTTHLVNSVIFTNVVTDRVCIQNIYSNYNNNIIIIMVFYLCIFVYFSLSLHLVLVPVQLYRYTSSILRCINTTRCQ